MSRAYTTNIARLDGGAFARKHVFLNRFRTALVRKRIVRVIERRQKRVHRTREFDARPSAHLFRPRHALRSFVCARVRVAGLPRAPVRNLHAIAPLTKHPPPHELIPTVHDVLIQIPHRVSSRQLRPTRSVRRRPRARRLSRVRLVRRFVRRRRARVLVVHLPAHLVKLERKLRHHTVRSTIHLVRVPVLFRSAVDARRRATTRARKRRRLPSRAPPLTHRHRARQRPRRERDITVVVIVVVLARRARAVRDDDDDDDDDEDARALHRDSSASSPGASLARRRHR